MSRQPQQKISNIIGIAGTNAPINSPQQQWISNATAIAAANPQPAKKKTVTLAMIVKNEAHVIQRCLSSVLPVIDHWVIVDTGSTDNTKEVIQNFFDQVGIPGELHESPWVDFAHNRTEVLKLAKDKADYTLMIDADEILVYDQNFNPEQWKQSLTGDIISVFAKFGSTEYHRPQLTSNRYNFGYKCPLHEYLYCMDTGVECIKDFVRGFHNQPIQDGNRSKNPQKYQDDAKLFENAIAKSDPKDEDYNRMWFYLAQSYRDSGDHKKALEAYEKRASLGGWDEEVYFSQYQCAIMKHILKYPVDDVITSCIQAYQTNSWRAEPLWIASSVCRVVGRFQQAYHFARVASRLQMPKGRLFITEPVYQYEIAYEMCISAYWINELKECRDLCFILLNNPYFPQERKAQIEGNLKHVQQLLATVG